MARDLSTMAGNATSALQAEYNRLKEIRDPAEMAAEARKVVAKGLSERNLEKFDLAVKDALRRRDPLCSVLMYLTNFILAGAGMSVDAGRRPGRKAACA